MKKNGQTFYFILFWYILPMCALIYNGIYVFHTIQILLLFLTSYVFAFFLFRNQHYNGLRILKINLSFVHKICVICTFLISLYYIAQTSDQDFSSLRMDFYEAKGIFSNTILVTLYGSFLMPLIVISLMALSFNYKDYRIYIFFGLITLILDAILRQGRFQLLYILFFLFYYRESYNLKWKYLFSTVFLAIILSFYTLYTRVFIKDAAITDLKGFLVPKVILDSTLNYQLYGYVFLDKLVGNLSPIGKFYEFNLFNQLFYLLNTFILTKIGMFYHYSWEKYNLILDRGMYSNHFDFDFNAFSTNFYPLFLDYGFFGIVFYGFVAGFFTAINSRNKLINITKTLNIFVLVFGLYQPVIVFLVGFIYLLLGIYIFFRYFIEVYKIAKFNT